MVTKNGFVHAPEEEVANALVTGPGDYYSTISDSLTGTSLLTALNTLNNKKRTKTIGYDNHRSYFQYTERVSSTPSNKMVGFYNNDLVSATWDNQATWNHEHIWPNSRGAGKNGSLSSPYIDADIHMVRPCAVSVNSSRGNKMYATSGAYDPGQYINEYRGIAARIIFYCAIADTRLSLTDNIAEASSKSSMGKLSDLLQWNLQYAPSTDSSASLALQVEQNRNEVIQNRSGLQGNRNPFIDHPEYACKIWGNTNASTQAICNGSIPDPVTVTLDKTSQSIEVGNNFSLTATTSDSSNVAWTLSSGGNQIVSLSKASSASGEAITVTGLKAGTATITATSGGNTASCTVTVTGGEQADPIILNFTSKTLALQESFDLIATTKDQSNITWTFDDDGWEILNFNKIETASGEALNLKAIKNGTTTITATYDYTDSLMLTRDSLIAMRNRMCKAYVGGPSDGSYMTTVGFEDVTTFRSFNLHGRYTAELRGLWETRGDFMGGPFVSITQYDEKHGRIVTVDGYVYAGKKDKRNYMRQVEAIMSTMEFVE